MKIAVCIATFKRPDGLARLLTGVSELTLGDDPPEVRIVVVDNDADGSAAAVCEAMRASMPWPITCVVEPRRGISHARNTAITTAGSDVDFIVFIDDDEAPEPSWLSELLEAQRRYDADVVTGPVHPVLPADAPRWIARGRFFDRKHYEEGAVLPYAFTNNVLVSAAVLRKMDIWFDPKMGLTGGGDHHFFQRVAQAGFRIVWTKRAVVREWIPPSRATLGWLTRRAYRVGNAMSTIEIDLGSPWFARLKQAAKGGVWLVLGLLALPIGLVSGRHRIVRGIRWLAYGAGLFAGLLGARYQEYQRNDSA